MSPLLILIFLALVVVVFLWFRAKSGGREIGSFWDILRHPNISDLDEMEEQRMSQEIEELAKMIASEEESLANLVDEYVFKPLSPQEMYLNQSLFRLLGEKTYPRTFEILRDASKHEALMKAPPATEEYIRAEQIPIGRVLMIYDFEAPPPQEAVALLAPFLTTENVTIRKALMLTLASIGSSEVMPAVASALRDSEPYVRSYTLMGMERALDAERVAEADKAKWFEWVANMWPQDTDFNVSSHVAELLILLDRDRALTRLMEPDLFSVKFQYAHKLLQAFSRHHCQIPREPLMKLIDAASQEVETYPMGNVVMEGLALLGSQRNEEDLPYLENKVEHPNEKVSSGAIQGLYAYHRYFEEARDPWAVFESEGWEALTPAEKHIVAVADLDAQVRNGGFAQYYYNSYGDQWKEAFEGLEVMGAVQHRAIMAKTLEKFPQGMPSVSRKARAWQLAKVVRKQENPFDAEDTAWYEAKEELLERQLYRYRMATLEKCTKQAASGASEDSSTAK